MSPKQRQASRDTILTKLAQLFTRESACGNERTEFSRSVEVVRLAIELARLHKRQTPNDFLGEAARLLTGASEALRDERARIEGQPAAMFQQAIAESERRAGEDYAAGFIPFAQIVRKSNERKENTPRSFSLDGETFEWDRILWKQFAGIVKGYLERVYENAVETIPGVWEKMRREDEAEATEVQSPTLRRARARIAFGHFAAQAKHVEELAEARQEADVREALARWRTWAEDETVRQWKKRAKAGQLRLPELRVLANYRDATISNKTRAATQAARSPEAKAKRKETKAKKRNR